jgi:hypothetical protein
MFRYDNYITNSLIITKYINKTYQHENKCLLLIIEMQIEHTRLSFLDRQSSDQNFSSRGNDWQSSEQSNRKLISLHNNGEDEKHAHGFADL